MDRRNQPPANFWGDSLNFWCRLWQAQFEQSVRFWGAMVAQMPRPSSRELAAEAESIRESCKPGARSAAAARATAAKTAAAKCAPKPTSSRPTGKPGDTPVAAPLH